MKILPYAMLAISTKNLPITAKLPRRVKAYTANGHNVVRSIYSTLLDDIQDEYLRHKAVAELLAKQFQWNDKYELAGGATKEGYVFVFVEK